jgi:uncharacterized protein
MTWSGFRPSDDACQRGYLVPSNCFAVVVLDYAVEIYNKIWPEKDVTKFVEFIFSLVDIHVKTKVE